MPRPKCLKPSYCHDKSSGRAFVTLNGKRVYLGAHGTAASRDEYDRVIGEWIASGRNAVVTPSTETAGITVSVVVAAFWQHAQAYYRTADGTPTSEVINLRYALRPLHKLYGPTPAAAFGPLALKALQQHMVGLGWARTHINRQTNRLRHVFKWAASNEMVTALAVDLGSFNNKADADVMRDLQAALTGSGEVMKKYGVIVSESRRQAGTA